MFHIVWDINFRSGQLPRFTEDITLLHTNTQTLTWTTTLECITELRLASVKAVVQSQKHVLIWPKAPEKLLNELDNWTKAEEDHVIWLKAPERLLSGPYCIRRSIFGCSVSGIIRVLGRTPSSNMDEPPGSLAAAAVEFWELWSRPEQLSGNTMTVLPSFSAFCVSA